MSEYHKIIRFPSITEKNTNMRMQENKYVFEVETSANKTLIKRAVENLFNVKVEKVNTANVSGKLKRMGKNVGYRPDWKKAIVKIKKGQTINQFGGV